MLSRAVFLVSIDRFSNDSDFPDLAEINTLWAIIFGQIS